MGDAHVAPDEVEEDFVVIVRPNPACKASTIPRFLSKDTNSLVSVTSFIPSGKRRENTNYCLNQRVLVSIPGPQIAAVLTFRIDK